MTSESYRLRSAADRSAVDPIVSAAEHCSGRPRMAPIMSCGSVARAGARAVPSGRAVMWPPVDEKEARGSMFRAFRLFDETLYFLTALVPDLFIKTGAVLVFDSIAALLSDVLVELCAVAFFGDFPTFAAYLFVERRAVFRTHRIAATFAGFTHGHLAAQPILGYFLGPDHESPILTATRVMISSGRGTARA